MKILQLNVWTGRIKGALLEFLNSNDFDVICMQEAVWIKDKQKELENFFVTVDQIKETSGLKHESRSSNWGMRIFSEDNIMEQGNVILSKSEIAEEHNDLVHNEYGIVESVQDFYEHAYTLQVAKLKNGLNVVNHHGYWKPTPMGDETTVKVMRKVANIVKSLDGPIVMCGDFNIIHEAPAMRELDFLRDLTYEYGVDNTLSGLKFNRKVACDHILVNDAVKVKRFRVLDDIVSDHKALVAEVVI